MFKHTTLFISLSLFWLPSSTHANPGAARLGLRRIATIAIATSAGVFGFTRNERNTSRILKKIQETAETTLEWFSEKLSEQKDWLSEKFGEQKDWLSEKFGEQKDEHAIMLKTLSTLDKQNDTLEKQNKVLRQQNALILSKIYDLETIIINQHMQGQSTSSDGVGLQKPDFLTNENEANEHPLTRHDFVGMGSECAA